MTEEKKKIPTKARGSKVAVGEPGNPPGYNFQVADYLTYNGPKKGTVTGDDAAMDLIHDVVGFVEDDAPEVLMFNPNLRFVKVLTFEVMDENVFDDFRHDFPKPTFFMFQEASKAQNGDIFGFVLTNAVDLEDTSETGIKSKNKLEQIVNAMSHAFGLRPVGGTPKVEAGLWGVVAWLGVTRYTSLSWLGRFLYIHECRGFMWIDNQHSKAGSVNSLQKQVQLPKNRRGKVLTQLWRLAVMVSNAHLDDASLAELLGLTVEYTRRVRKDAHEKVAALSQSEKVEVLEYATKNEEQKGLPLPVFGEDTISELPVTELRTRAIAAVIQRLADRGLTPEEIHSRLVATIPTITIASIEKSLMLSHDVSREDVCNYITHDARYNEFLNHWEEVTENAF